MFDKFLLNWNRVPYKNIDILIIAVCKLLDAFGAFLLFGFYLPNLHAKYVVWRTKKMFNVKKELCLK